MAFGGNFAQLVDKRPSGVVLSPSQIDKFDRCKRAWAFEYIGGIRPPPKPSAELGTLVHAILEAWLTYGTPPDIQTKAGKIAAKMIAHLPLPGTGVTERNFYFVTRNGFAYTGKIDWSGIFWNWPTIVDHKTTGSLEWAKTEAGLHCDVQGISYTIAGCYGFEVDEIQLLWNYGTTKDRDPIVNPVRTRLRLPIVEEKFEHVIEPLAAEIVSARTARLDPHSFPGNPHACGDFGGCPHKRICRMTQEERMQALMTDPQNPTLAARLTTLPQGGGFTPPNGGGGFAPPQNGYAPPQNGFVPQQQQQPQQAYTPPQGAVFAPPQQGFMPPAQAQPQGFAPPQQPAPQQGFAPPQQQPMPPQQNGFTPPQHGAAPNGAPMFNPNSGPNAPENGVQMPQQTQAQAPTEEKRGRGRPKKTEAGPVLLEQEAFIAGVGGMMSNPGWNGQLDQLVYAGELAIQALHSRKWA